MLRSTPFAKYSPGSLGISHGILAAAFLLRLLALCRLAVSPSLLPTGGDMSFYNDWALRILHGQWTDHYAFYGLPLYAYWLAAFYKLFGYTPFIPGLIQCAADAGTAVLIFKLAVRIFGGDSAPTRVGIGMVTGLVAVAGWAFFLPAQAYAIVLMPTSLFIFVFWFVVWQIVKRSAAPSGVGFFGLGALIGFTAMAVATVLTLLPLVFAAIWFKWQPRLPGIASKFSAVALLLAGTFTGTAPCWLHNRFVAHDPVFLSAHGGINLWIGNNPDATGYPKFPGMHTGQAALLQDSIALAEAAAGRPLLRSETSAYWSARAHKFIAEHPGAWLKLLAKKVTNFWNAWQYDDIGVIASLREGGIILPGIRFALVATFALPGICFALRARPSSRWPFAAILLQVATLLPVFVTERYRLAAVPGLLLFAGYFLHRLWESFAAPQFRRLALDLISLAAATLFVSLPRNDPAVWALDFYNTGSQALQSKNLALAEEQLSRAYGYAPENAEINLALGNLRLEQHRPAEAASFYRATLASDPRHSAALNNLGVLALDQNRFEEAAHLFRQALQIEPASAKAHYLLARVEAGLGQLHDAMAEVAIAIRLNPSQPEFHELEEILSAKLKSSNPSP